MRNLDEDEALAILARALGRPNHQVSVGIGDDCAVLRPLRGESVWTIDACQEGVHFSLEWMDLADVAWRSLNAAVSDLAAMGAKPVGALCQLTLPKGLSRAKLQRFALAQAEASRELRCPIIGGNVTAGQRFEVVTSALGEAPVGRSLGRQGAKVGDELWLVGNVGRARAGLLCLQQGRQKRGALAQCVAAFRRPRALVTEGQRLLGAAHACLDVSDGLARDAGHLAAASGVALILSAEALLDDAVVERAAQALGEAPLDLVLQGGEDYALLAVGPRRRRPRFARAVGTVEAGRGVAVEMATGRKPAGGGFVHRT